MTNKTTDTPDWVKRLYFNSAVESNRGNGDFAGWRELPQKAQDYVHNAVRTNNTEALNELENFAPTLKKANALLAEDGFVRIPNNEAGLAELDEAFTTMRWALEAEVALANAPDTALTGEETNIGKTRQHSITD